MLCFVWYFLSLIHSLYVACRVLRTRADTACGYLHQVKQEMDEPVSTTNSDISRLKSQYHHQFTLTGCGWSSSHSHIAERIHSWSSSRRCFMDTTGHCKSIYMPAARLYFVKHMGTNDRIFIGEKTTTSANYRPINTRNRPMIFTTLNNKNTHTAEQSHTRIHTETVSMKKNQPVNVGQK